MTAPKLSAYEAKRDFKITAEPSGEADVAAVATPAKGKTGGELAAASASGAPVKAPAMANP